MSEWIKGQLSNIATIEMGQSPKKEDVNTLGLGLPLLNGPTEFGSHHPNPLQYSESSKRVAEQNSLLFCVRGSTTGRMNWADQKYGIGRGLAAIKHKKGKDYNPYLRGLIEFKLPALLAEATGSTFPNVSKSQLNDLEISFPSSKEQKTIAHILGTLDDKIELNRQMNQNLEAMAQALFKSWFVDFDPVMDNAIESGAKIPEALKAKAEKRQLVADKKKLIQTNPELAKMFPSSFVFNETLEKWIPEGWENTTFGEQYNFLNGNAFKSKELLKDYAPDNFHVFKMGNIKRGGGFNFQGTKSYYPKTDSGKLEKYLLKKGDVLMAMTDMKSNMALLAHTALMPLDNVFLLNQRVGCLRAKPKSYLNYSYLYLYSNSPEAIDDLRSRSNSGVQVNLSTSEIKDTRLLLPSIFIHHAFDSQVNLLYEKTFKFDDEIKTLTQLRDTLLPQLISGKVRVSQEVF